MRRSIIITLILSLIICFSVSMDVQAREGGKLVYAQTIDVFRFDPYDLAIGNFAMLHTVYDPIIHVNKNSEPEPWLAKSWKFSEDGTELTLFFEKGVRFHSGREMKAEDVKWTIEQYQDPANAAIIREATLLIKKMEVLDDYTLKLIFDKPYPAVFDMLELIFVVDKEGKEKIHHTPAGTGPFKLKEWIPGYRVTYVRNKDYWRKGEPYLDEFVQQIYPDQQAMVAALEAGNADIVMYPTVQDFNRLKNNPNVVAYTAFGCCETNLNFNVKHKPWDDKRVRKAIDHAINRQRLVDIAFYGNSYPIVQPIRTGWGHNPNVTVEKYAKYDLELARKLLEEAGYADGFKMEALCSSSVMPESTILAQIMKEDLAKLNIDLEILDLEQTAYNNMGDKSLYKDIYIQIVGRTNKDPGSLYSLTVAYRPYTNVAQYRNEEYERLVKEGLETVDPERRRQIYWRLAEIVAEEAFSIVIAPRPEFYLLSRKVDNFKLTRDGFLLSHILKKKE